MVADGLEIIISSGEKFPPKSLEKAFKMLRNNGYSLRTQTEIDQPVSLKARPPSGTLSIEEAINSVSSQSEVRSQYINDELDITFDLTVYPSQFELAISSYYFYNNSYDVVDLLTKLINQVAELHMILGGSHTYSIESPVPEYLMEQFHSIDKNREIISWTTIFGEESIRDYGREELLSAPVYRVEELENDDIIMILSQDIENAEHTDIYYDVREHLGYL